MRAREDDGKVIPGSLQTATLYSDRVEYEDGTVVRECPEFYAGAGHLPVRAGLPANVNDHHLPPIQTRPTLRNHTRRVPWPLGHRQATAADRCRVTLGP